MKQEHTPGPWEVDEFGYINAGGQQIADVHVYDSSNCMECGQCEGHSVRNEPKLPYQANARLMAAAPELLEFVEDVAEGLDTGGNPGYLEDAVENLEERAQRIIARIKGDE